MDEVLGHVEEIKSLQRCINDLVSVLALPAIWAGRSPAQVIDTLLDALLGMLSLDIVYARLKDPAGGAPIETLRISRGLSASLQEIGDTVNRAFGESRESWSPVVRVPCGQDSITLAAFRLGVLDDAGLIVGGSHRADFPKQTERLLFGVAANQAAIGLQEARLLAEQTRAAAELDERAALRTRELAAAVEELQLRVNMLQQLPVAAWSITPDGTPDIVNQSWFDLTGQTPRYVTSYSEAWMGSLHPEDRERAAKIYWDAIRAGVGFTMETRFLRAKDGTYRWHLNRAVPVRDTHGKILRFVGTSTDIEDQKRAQEDLRSTQADLAHMTRVTTMGELTASIAHEVNQPLSGIITNANTCLRMLAAEPPNVDGARETARRTIRDGNRAAAVIARLHALFSKKEIAAEAVDLSEAAREVIALCSSTLQRDRVQLRSELAADLPAVAGDRVQLQQVILNLLTNASDAMTSIEDRPRELLVRTEAEDADLVRVTVRDTGIGFSPQDADKLFAAFYTTKRNGMGIGLSVSRSIIESHHGRLWATTNDGPGATFAFSVPASPLTTLPASS